MHANRKLLAKQGYFVGLPRNKSPLVQIYRCGRINSELSHFFKHFLNKLNSSFPQEWVDFHTIIISAEIIGSAIHTSTEAQGLYSYIQEVYGASSSCAPKVIAYLRRQDEVAISMLSTLARQGRMKDFKDIKAIRYSRMLGAWSNLPERPEIEAVRYAKTEWRNSSLIDDFFYRIDPKVSFKHQPEHDTVNTSLNTQGIAILADVAAHIQEQCPTFDFRASSNWKTLVKSIETSCSGRPPIPSPEELVQYMSTVGEDNEIVEREWIRDGRPLFVCNDTKNVTLDEENLTATKIQSLYSKILATLIRSSNS